MGLEVELEHGSRDPATNVSDDDEVTTSKIAWAHLNEFPDYYTRLARMEAEAERYWAHRGASRPSDRHRGRLRRHAYGKLRWLSEAAPNQSCARTAPCGYCLVGMST